MTEIEALTENVKTCKGTLDSATATIRTLITQRNEALSATTPEDIAAVKENNRVAQQVINLNTELEASRKGLELAITDAQAAPVITPKPKPLPPPPPAPAVK